MRERLRLLMLTLLCAAFGQAMAQEVILDFTTNDVWQFPEGSSNKGTAAATFSNGEYAITLEATSNGYYFSTYQGTSYLMLGKTDATLTLPAFNFAVATIEVVGNANASGNVKQNIFVGDEAICTETTGAQGTNKYDIPAEYQSAGTIYTLKILNNYNSQIRQINIYKTGQSVKDTPTIQFDNTSFTAILGEDFNAPALTYTGNGVITYSSDAENVATVDASTGAVDIVGVGTANITASATETSTCNAVSTSYKITVIEPQGGHEIVDGIFDFTDVTDYGSGLQPSDSQEYITEDNTWTAGNVTLVTSGKYRWWFNANGNTLRLYNNVVDEVQTSKLTISVPEGKTISKIDMTGSSLAFTSNVGEFASNTWTGEAQSVELTYSGSGAKTIKTITVTYDNGGTPPVEKETPTMKFSSNYFTVILGNDFTAPELTYNGDGAVTYASDNEAAVTVDSTTGAVDIVGVGKAVITATAAETANFYGATASYTINVAEDQGTHEVVDGTFDFTDNTDYGSGLVPSDENEYIYDDNTWTAGNVTLVTSGKYRWWLNASGNTLRFYSNEVDGAQTSKFVISVPAGNTISKIEMTGSKLEFTANVGEFADGNWTGSAQSVEFTYTGTGTKQIKTITVTYGNGETPVKETPTMKFSSNYFTVILGDDFTAPELTYNGDGAVTYASDNEAAVTVDPTTGAVDIVGVGRAVITATAAETANFYGATASYTISVAEDQGTHEVVDGTFDFTDNTDYGTGLVPSDENEYIYDDNTWTAGNVTLVTSGKYRWWLNANGNTLRFYSNEVEGVQTSKFVISVPAGSTISKIEMTGSKLEFTANEGEFADGVWTGEAQSVEFTYTGTGTKQIKTITVTYSNGDVLIGDADGDGEVSINDVMKLVGYILNNETEGLNFDNADIDGSGVLDINDISGIVAIILGN